MAVSLEKQWERRTRILTAVRRVLAQRGYEQLAMKEIAAEAGVTVPTLYNRFGSKDNLVAAAIEDLLRVQIDAVLHNHACSGLERIVATALIPVHTMVSDPDYARALISAANGKAAGSVASSFNGFAELYLLGLREMYGRGELADWFSAEDMALSLRLHIGGAGRLWGVGLETAEVVKHHTLLGVYLLLHSIAVGDMAEHLRTEIVRLQSAPPIGRMVQAPAGEPLDMARR